MSEFKKVVKIDKTIFQKTKKEKEILKRLKSDFKKSLN